MYLTYNDEYVSGVHHVDLIHLCMVIAMVVIVSTSIISFLLLKIKIWSLRKYDNYNTVLSLVTALCIRSPGCIYRLIAGLFP